MAHLFRMLAALVVTLAGLSAAIAQAPEPRIALVIGNSAYQAGSLATPANDAGLVAQTLTQAGFDVIGARDLDQDGLRRSFRDFLDKAAASGPDTVAFVYLAGYGLQYAGENYFAPIEAGISRDSSVPLEALRIADFTRALADLPLKARFMVLDAARANPFAPTGQPLAGGLALVQPEQGSLIAFNAAPGTIPPQATGDYGPYAKALAEMMQEGGLDAKDVFARVRLRVSDETRGAQAPWNASRLTQPFVFFERAADAPPPSVAQAPRDRALRDLPVAEAYALALERDTFAGYQEFLTAFPRDPLSPRVEAMLAARREALTWRRAVARNTPQAYWSYIRRYPRGPHLADAHRRLAILSASLEPPAVFDEYDFEVPPPPPEEYVFLSGPVMVFDEAYYPPPPPIYFLPPPRREYIELPPPRFSSPGFLPIPVPIFLPSARPWRHDVYRQPPPVRLPTGVSPRDPGAPPRFVAPPLQRPRPQPDFLPPVTRPIPLQNQPTVQQTRPVPLLTPQQLRQQELQARRQQDFQRQQQLQAQRLQMQREQQVRSQQLQRQRAEQLRAQQYQRREQQLRAQQQYQQRQQQLRSQQQYQQREQQMRAQQQYQQRQQQMRAQQQYQQREQQLRSQQQYQQREQQMRVQQQRQLQQQRELQLRSQQQTQQIRAQQQQQQQQMQRQQQQQQMQRQQQMQQQQIQQQMQRQREQQQRVQQQQQQQRQHRTDCGGPGKPPCR